MSKYTPVPTAPRATANGVDCGCPRKLLRRQNAQAWTVTRGLPEPSVSAASRAACVALTWSYLRANSAKRGVGGPPARADAAQSCACMQHACPPEVEVLEHAVALERLGQRVRAFVTNFVASAQRGRARAAAGRQPVVPSSGARCSGRAPEVEARERAVAFEAPGQRGGTLVAHRIVPAREQRGRRRAA